MPRGYLKYALLLLSLGCYIVFGYFTVRSQFGQLMLVTGTAFAAYFLLIATRIKLSISVILLASIIFRLSLLFIVPNLSDDYFRFAWDGKLVAHGENPYLVFPSTYVGSEAANAVGITQELFNGLNSPEYYTIYPPVNQWMFGAASWIAGDDLHLNIILLRLFIFLAEIGTILLIFKLLKVLNKPPEWAAVYALNPLVITELTGNLHFEGVMLFCLLLAIYLLVKGRLVWSAFVFAIAVGVKLIPLMFLPFLIRRIGWKKSILYYSIVGIVVVLLFVPFVNEMLIRHFFSSVELYFGTFEFNAGLWYLLRPVGEAITGYNLIRQVAPILSLLTFTGILWMAFQRDTTWETMLKGMLMAATLYLACSTIVHPWYLATLLLLSVFVHYRYVVVWSLLILLTYATYRDESSYTENLWLVGIEYFIVTMVFLYEWRGVKQQVVKP